MPSNTSNIVRKSTTTRSQTLISQATILRAPSIEESFQLFKNENCEVLSGLRPRLMQDRYQSLYAVQQNKILTWENLCFLVFPHGWACRRRLWQEVQAPPGKNQHYRLFSHSRLLPTFSYNTKNSCFFCLYHHFRQMMVKKEKSWWRWRRWWWLRRTRKQWIRRWLREQLPILSPSPPPHWTHPAPRSYTRYYPFLLYRYYPILLYTNSLPLIVYKICIIHFFSAATIHCGEWIHCIACCDCVVCLLTCLPKQYNIIWDINCSLVR